MKRARPTYKIEEIPGAGATSTVCLARNETGRRVALKVLNRNLNAKNDAVVRARDEARMLSRLRHDHVVHVEELLDVDGRTVIQMECVEGVALDRVLRKHREGFPIAVAVEVCRRIALALDAAYNAPCGPDGGPMRIVHRDVKPSNVLMDVRGEVKLTDFGHATGDFEDREAQSVYLVHGDPGFMAPERFDGVPDSPAVDVYALGRTLFHLATGRPIVVSRAADRHDDGLKDQLAFLAPKDAPAVAQHALRDLIRRMSVRNPAERPSPADVARSLERWLAGAGLSVDLAAFAREAVRPLYDARTRMIPHEHPSWSEVAFLEREATPPGAEPRLPVADVDRRVRDLLLRPDWPAGLDELVRLTGGRHDWDVNPLVNVIDRALVPAWNFWTPRPSAEELLGAIRVLGPRHREPAIVARLQALVRTQTGPVAKAARTALGT